MKINVHSRARQCGFSMVELLIVVAIMMVIAALALPGIAATLANIRTRFVMGQLSGITQNCRSLAVRRSKTKSLHVTTSAGRTIFFTQTCDQASCVGDINGRTANEDSILYLPDGFSVASKSEAPAELLPEQIWGSTINPTLRDISFNSRGLPCDLSLLPCDAPKGFIVYLKYVGTSTRWIALTVSPAGRVKNYYWNSGKWGD